MIVNALWWIVAIIVATMLWSLWRVLSRDNGSSETDDRLVLNRRAYREREAEIERQFVAGELNADERSRLSNENARQLLNDADRAATAVKRGDRISVFAFMAVLLVVGGAGLYAWLGAHQQVTQWFDLQHRAQDDQHKNSMEEMLLLLRTRLQNDPEDSDGWFMLGRSMLSLQQAQLAAQAFARAKALSPNDPDIIVAYAQALRLGSGESSGDEVDRLLRQARLLSPEHEGAVLMTAYRHFEKGEFAEAIPLFEKLKLGRAGDAEAVKMIDESIARARQGLMASGAAVPVTAPPVAAPQRDDAVNNEQIEVSVDLTAAVKSAVPATARVFIYAKALQGPPMPLAVVTTTVAQLPTTVSLSDANAMNPAMKLSTQANIQVIARVSMTGNANATPGDWQGDLNLNDWRKQKRVKVLIQNKL